MNYPTKPDDAKDRYDQLEILKLSKTTDQSASSGSSTAVESMTRGPYPEIRRESIHQGQAEITRADGQFTKSNGVLNVIQTQRRASLTSVISGSSDATRESSTRKSGTPKAVRVLTEYFKFVGPGFMIAVAYIDPGNYATDVSAGAATQYKLLFMVLLSNLIAIFVQTLSILLGSVTGLDLAQNCRKHLPRWLNWALYVLSETAIIATDVAEVSH